MSRRLYSVLLVGTILATEVSGARASDGRVHAAALGDLTFNEIMYHPAADGAADANEFEFLEIKNTGTDPVDVSGLYFSAGIQYVFPPGTTLEPGQIVVLAAVPSQFEARYGFNPFGAYVGRLDNAGETVSLVNAQGVPVLEVTYDDELPWPPAADGAGFSLVPVDPESNPDPNDPSNWRASSAEGGSPGADDGPPGIEPPIVINELLAHTDPPQQDAVELHNPADASANIGGWYLTDNVAIPRKYQIPLGTVIPPGGFLVLNEEDFNRAGDPGAFSFSSTGEEVYLFSADDEGRLTGYAHGFSFGASENQVSFGRYLNSVGEEHFVRQRTLTFGQENSGPRPSPIAINEIMYHPSDGQDEFLELMNVTDGVVPLFDPVLPQNTWRVNGIGYTLPQGVILAAGEPLLIVPVAPEEFRTRYGLPAELKIVGPYTGALSNGGERISLERPDPPNQDGAVPYIVVESVRYADRDPWPTAPDGNGPSLERIDPHTYGDDPANWRASFIIGGTPGDATNTATDGSRPVLRGFELSEAYPNPFHESLAIGFAASSPQHVRIDLFDALGRHVANAFDEHAAAGIRHEVSLTTTGWPSGIYLIRLQGVHGQVWRSAVLIR